MKKLVLIIAILTFSIVVSAQTGDTKPASAKVLQTPNNPLDYFDPTDTILGKNMGQYGYIKLAPLRMLSRYVPRTVLMDMKEPTGFLNGSAINVSYDWTTRTVTLTGDLSYYWRGLKRTLTSPWTSSAHTATVGKWYLSSSDGINFTWSQSIWSFSDIQVAAINYKATAAASIALRETHGIMPWQVHEELHQQVGTYLTSGGQATAGTFTLNTASDAATTPGFDAFVLKDEDNSSSEAAWTEGTYTTMYIGAGNTSVFNTAATFPFISAGSFMQWNNTSTGALNTSGNNSFYNVYSILLPVASSVNSQKYRVIMLQPQVEYNTQTAAEGENVSGLNLGELASLSPEFKIYARLTYGTNSGDANTGKCRLLKITYVLGSNGSVVNVPLASSNHAALSNLGWTASGHTGTNDNLASFDGAGVATVTPKTDFANSSIYPNSGLTTGYLPYKSATVLANSPMYTNGTNIGLGITNPLYLLHISPFNSSDANYVASIDKSYTGTGSPIAARIKQRSQNSSTYSSTGFIMQSELFATTQNSSISTALIGGEYYNLFYPTSTYTVTCQDAIGIRIRSLGFSGTGTSFISINNSKGVHVQNQGGSPVLTSHGIYVDSQTGSSIANYSIYTNAGINYLGDKTGIKVQSPTAILHLPAGTASASTAPLKFTSGVNLTTPEAGAMEYDGTNLYFTPSAARNTVAFRQDLEYVNVKNLGAVADGVTDETTLLQGIITNNRSVYFPAGTYLVSTLNIPSDTRILTDGYLTIFKAKSGVVGDYSVLSVVGSRVSIASCKIQGNISTDTGEQRHAIQCYANASSGNLSDITIGNIIAENMRGDGLYIGNAAGYTITQVSAGSIFANNVYRNGVSITGGKDIYIRSINGTAVGLITLAIEPNLNCGAITNVLIDYIKGHSAQVAGPSAADYCSNITINNLDINPAYQSYSTPAYSNRGSYANDGLVLRNIKSLSIDQAKIEGYNRMGINCLYSGGELGVKDLYIKSLEILDCAKTDTQYYAFILATSATMNIKYLKTVASVTNQRVFDALTNSSIERIDFTFSNDVSLFRNCTYINVGNIVASGTTGSILTTCNNITLNGGSISAQYLAAYSSKCIFNNITVTTPGAAFNSTYTNHSINNSTINTVYHSGNVYYDHLFGTFNGTGLATNSGILRLGANNGNGLNGPETINGIEFESNFTGNGYGTKLYTNNATDYFGIATRYNSATWTERLVIKESNGAVLVGTNSDNGTDKFQVNGSAYFNGASNATSYKISGTSVLLDAFKSGSAGASNTLLVGQGTTSTPAWQNITTAIGDNYIKAQNASDQTANYRINGSGQQANIGLNMAPSSNYVLEITGGYDKTVARFLRYANYGEVIKLGRSGVSESAGIGYPADGSISFITAAGESGRFNASGFLGLKGITSPSAILHLPAGSASASTAPIKFTAGTNMTNAEAGALEWDGSKLYITQTTGPTRKTIAYTSDITSTINLTVQALSGTTPTWDVANGQNATLTLTGNTILTLSNITAGSSGNLTVTNASTTYTLELAGYTNKISPVVYSTTNKVLTSGGSKIDVFSWYYDGTRLLWNGSNDYK